MLLKSSNGLGGPVPRAAAATVQPLLVSLMLGLESYNTRERVDYTTFTVEYSRVYTTEAAMFRTTAVGFLKNKLPIDVDPKY